MAGEALLYDKEGENGIRCALCAHRCRIEPGSRGVCGVRENRAGLLISLVSRAVVAAQCDPIEKKPLFHVLPGSRS
jgi:pyruvate formate lyase activating enzyme